MNPTASTGAVGSIINDVSMSIRLLMYTIRSGLLLVLLLSVSIEALSGQQPGSKLKTDQGALLRFASQKSAIYKAEKRKADSLAEVLSLPVSYFEKNGGAVALQRLGRKNKPVYYATDNINAAALISADQLWNNNNGYPSLSGEGIEINLWDGGAVLISHQEFQGESGSRVTLRDIESTLSNHSTHIAGTIIASGVNTNARGMAGKSIIKGWDYNNDLSEMASAAADGILVSNHSYGPLCGWYYNTVNESWYWYGDPDISETEDYKFGFYDQQSSDLDYIAFHAPYYLIVKSAGNDRNDYPSESSVHFVWDEAWKLATTIRDPDGGTDGYDCLNPMAVAKNILTVGALDDDGAMTDFSSFGPTDDGRIKPDIVANGYSVYSSVATSAESYESYSGTSMATASVTGSVALLRQLQNILSPGVPLISSTVKALLIHSATDAGINPGPDYSFGWGLVNVKEAADLISQNSGNGGKNIYQGIVIEGETIIIPVETTLSTYMKVTLCWTDPAAQPSSVSLNPRTSRLINDLDVRVENNISHQIYLPWVLDVENPSAAATKGINHIDNVEQIMIDNPGENSYNIIISHSGSLTGGAQSYSLVVDGISTQANIFPPKNITFKISLPAILLKWNAPETGNPVSYKLYRNNQFLAETSDTSFSDESVVLNNMYEYYVTAVYELSNNLAESIGTNKIKAFPQTLRPLPFVIDFEDESMDIAFKNNETGWLWGDSESLNCYYLDFSADTTSFIGADSYSMGDAVHTWDVASTAPLRLEDYENIKLSFDYMLKTGIYGAIDEFHIVYKLQEETEWQDLISLGSSFKWKHESIDLPPEICKNGTQIGFYYDDMYQWGMGAGLDNINISGEQTRYVDLSMDSMTSPISSCSLTESENIIVNIRNNGTHPALPGDIITIQMTLSTGVSTSDVIILKDELSSGGTITYQMSAPADLSEAGNYTFDFTIISEFDHNDLNDQLSEDISVYGNPEALILNSESIFCADDPQVLVQVSPSGGTLSGTGITGLFFNPAVAGEGNHIITYSFTDDNGCNAMTSTLFTVNGLPQPAILNPDLSFCEDEPPAQIIVSPAGGNLSGQGINEGYFYPDITGAGTFYITYDYTDASGCSAITSANITVNENPTVDIGNDTTIALDKSFRIELPDNGLSFLWFDGSTGSYLSIEADDYGIGIYDIWVTATNSYLCSTTDSLKLTIDMTDNTGQEYESQALMAYPNPTSSGFYLRLNDQEQVISLALYGYDGIVRSCRIPDTFPYIDISGLPAGYYILKVRTNRNIYSLTVIKR